MPDMFESNMSLKARDIRARWFNIVLNKRWSKDPRFYGCVVGEIIHRKVDIRYVSERILGYHGPIIKPWMRLIKEDTPFKRDQGMVFVNPYAQSADDFCAELRAQTRQSRINGGADPDTGLMPSAHPSILRKIKQLPVLI